MRVVPIAALLLFAGGSRAQEQSTVGVPARIEALVLPAPELEVVPVSSSSAIVLRITAKYPHGTAFRYDLEYTGLDPGEYDLSQWLRPLAGASEGSVALPPIPVTILSLLPPGQVLPHPPVPAGSPALGGYRMLLVGAGLLWVAGLIAILRIGRRRALAAAESARPRTLAERLRPLVEHALAGRLSRVERARLELSLVAYWRGRLGLDALDPPAALRALREHADAGPLLRSLEEWLHAPVPAHEVDLAALLAPYRDLPADAMDVPEVRALASS
jgi:hypothetical protein